MDARTLGEGICPVLWETITVLRNGLIMENAAQEFVAEACGINTELGKKWKTGILKSGILNILEQEQEARASPHHSASERPIYNEIL